MTELELRNRVVSKAREWIGRNAADDSYWNIIQLYNGYKPLPRGYAVKRGDAWCATFVSAVGIASGLTEIMPRECSCPQMIELYRKIGRWMERDDYVPSPGDIILYDWQDSGNGDNTGTADHIGIVETVSNGIITVIEGNMSNAVGRRTIAVNGRYIRGYCLPDYAGYAADATPKPKAIEQEESEVYHKLRDIPNDSGFRDIIELLMDAQIICGDGSDKFGNEDVIDLTHEQVRTLIFLYRGGGFDKKLTQMGLPPAVR